MTITLRFCETDLTVDGEYHAAERATLIAPPECEEFEIATVKTRCGDDITGIFGEGDLSVQLELACLKALKERV